MATDQERLLLLLEAQTRNFERALKQAQSAADLEASRIERRFQQMNRKVQQDFSNFANQARTALAALGVGLVVRDVTQLADVWTTVGNRLAFAGVSSERLAATQQAVADIASQTRSDLDATADLFARMFRSSEDLGASMERVLRVTEIVSKALAGASQSERQGAIRQLGQGLGSGRLQGDELRSILENSRPIAEAIANEFDTTVGNLRKLGQQGVLESRRVFEAIENAGADIDEAFSRTTFTVADSFTRLRTEAARFIGTNEQTSASVRSLTRLIDLVANNFDLLADAVIVTATVIGGAFAGTAIARAVTALATMIGSLTTAAARATALQSALSFFGGPLGIALTVAGGAFAYVATQTDLLTTSAQAAARAEDSLYTALQTIVSLGEDLEATAASGEAAADATGQLGDAADAAQQALDRSTEASRAATGQMDLQARAARGLAEAEKARAIATIEAAIADQQSLQASIRRQRFLEGLGFGLGLGSERGRQMLRDGERPSFALTDDEQRAIADSEESLRTLQSALEAVRSLSADVFSGAGAGGSGGGGGSNDPATRARRQAVEDLALQAELSLARLRHEEARVRELEDAEQIEKRTQAYVQAGLALTVSRQRAEEEVRAEREASNAEARRSYELAQLQDRIDIARLENNVGLAEAMSDQLEIARRTREIVDQLAVSEAEAAQMAREQVGARREALEIERRHQLELRGLEDEAEAARLRSDSAAERAINRRLELEQRIEELRRLGLEEGAAAARAEAEIAALEEADFQGQFRRWFTGGITAALEGDLGEFFENWLKERAAAGLENALNQVADVLFDAFKGVLTNVIRSGQDGLGQAVAAVFAGGATGGLNQLGAEAAAAGEALSNVLAASATEAGAKLALSGAAAAASAAKEAASAASKTAADLSVTSSSIILAKSLLAAAAAAQTFAASSGGGKGGIFGKIIGAVAGGLKFGGGKSVGGPINPGFLYRVHKDELITPAVPSYVMPRQAPAMQGPMQIAVNLKNESGVPLEANARATIGADGKLGIEVGLSRMISTSLASGQQDEVLRGRYGVRGPMKRRS